MQFFLLEAGDLEVGVEPTADGGAHATDGGKLYESLIEDFRAIPKITNDSGYDNYAVINVSPSVVPNPYVPTFRIFVYNVTGGDESMGWMTKKRNHGHRRGKDGNKESECKKPEYSDTWKCRLKEPWYSDGDAPSRKNKKWTPIGYAQVRGK